MGAADEIFLGRSPLLLVVEPGSLLLGGLRLAERTVVEWCRLSDLFTQVRRAFDLVTPEGDLNTAAQAQATFATAPAATGRLADQVELAVLDAVDAAVRSSSAVECVNARVRLVQVARKRLGEDFLYLLALWHNLHSFGRGSVREGHSPAELAGIELPTPD